MQVLGRDIRSVHRRLTGTQQGSPTSHSTSITAAQYSDSSSAEPAEQTRDSSSSQAGKLSEAKRTKGDGPWHVVLENIQVSYEFTHGGQVLVTGAKPWVGGLGRPDEG